MKNRKQQILSTAAKLFSENEFNKVSTKAIADKAGVSEGLIFKHYGSKNNLFREIFLIASDEIMKTLKTYQSEKPVIEEHLDSVRENVLSNFELWRFFHLNRGKLYSGDLNINIEKSYKNIASLISKVFDDKPLYNAQLLISTIDGVVNNYVFDKDKDKFINSIKLLIERYSDV